MRIQLDNHEIPYEGDIGISLWLDLPFNVQMHHGNVEGITLDRDDVEVQGITLSRGQSEIILDGERENDALPPQLADWFLMRFLDEWNDAKIDDDLYQRVAERAVDKHYEQLAAA